MKFLINKNDYLHASFQILHVGNEAIEILEEVVVYKMGNELAKLNKIDLND